MASDSQRDGSRRDGFYRCTIWCHSEMHPAELNHLSLSQSVTQGISAKSAGTVHYHLQQPWPALAGP
jgi:hypothetical protein